MAFWGAEVRPGRAVTHVNGGPRLRVTQATLGKSINGNSGKCSVTCIVGNKAPVKLCNLIPGTGETCQIHVEFDESDKVVFSVIGPMTVHLSGYFKQSGGRRRTEDDESESYGEDIRSFESKRSSHPSEEEEALNDSFINDDDPGHMSATSASIDSVDESNKRRVKRKKAKHKRLRKAYTLVESDDESSSHHQGFGSEIDLEAKHKDTPPEDTKDAVLVGAFEGKTDDGKKILDGGKHLICIEDDAGDFFADTMLKFSKPREKSSEDKTSTRKRKVQTEGNALKEKCDNGIFEEDFLEQNKNKDNNRKQESKAKIEDNFFVESLEEGKQNGKVAALGKKVKVLYTGKWKTSGEVFYSNVDGCPLSFILGGEGVMEAWNVGLSVF
ncbi:Peptidyl-prolyl cis-trans isomerase FKBP43 [Linum perenne]